MKYLAFFIFILTVCFYSLGFFYQSGYLNYFGLTIHEFSFTIDEYIFYGFIGFSHLFSIYITIFFTVILIIISFILIVIKLFIKITRKNQYSPIAINKIKLFSLDDIKDISLGFICVSILILLFWSIWIILVQTSDLGKKQAIKGEQSCVKDRIYINNKTIKACKLICRGSYCAYIDSNTTYIYDNNHLVTIKRTVQN